MRPAVSGQTAREISLPPGEIVSGEPIDEDVRPKFPDLVLPLAAHAGPVDVVLDTFCGSGTTILAAERVGRHARALEIEPRFADVAIRRWQAFTRLDARHAESGLSFDEIAAEGSRVPKLASKSRGKT